MPQSTRISLLILVLAALAVTPACRSTTWNARFTPTPAETLVGPIQPDGSGMPLARVLLSVRGAERRGGDPHASFEMRIRMRVENRSDTALELLLSDFLLLDADLAPFGPARLDAPIGSDGVLSVPAGLPILLDLRFEFPDGHGPEELDLDGLNLRGALRSGPDVYLLGVTFTRGPRVIYRSPWYGYDPYYGPWGGPGPYFYGGYGYRW
jgi:hypothetical protein